MFSMSLLVLMGLRSALWGLRLVPPFSSTLRVCPVQSSLGGPRHGPRIRGLSSLSVRSFGQARLAA